MQSFAGMPLWDMVVKLAISLLLGGLIGLERETHGRPAGLRTHILVCMGSTLYALSSYTLAGHKYPAYDPGRVIAQIVTGIGFLGAGTIMRQGSVVRGLTTAASIWTVAAIGIAVAIGGQTLVLAAIASVLVYGTLNILPNIERHVMLRRGEKLLTIATYNDQESISRVLSLLSHHGAFVRVIGSEESDDHLARILRVRVHVGRDFDESPLSNSLAANKDVINYSWD